MHIAPGNTFLASTLLALASGTAYAGTFPDFGFAPPSSFKGKLFELSQDFPKSPPTTLPAFFKSLPTAPSNDFEVWRAYVDEVKAYCLEGNVAADWVVQNNKVRNWYHAPWQHYGPLGREGIHGLTKEAPIASLQLAPTQKTGGQTYAVGIYNDIGGYTFGRVWQDPQNPDPSVTSAPNSFGDGTVVCKALFADVVLKEVPFLVNPIIWQGYITDDFNSANRTIKPVALIQMDFAVRDKRIKETGWIFGTFQYNGAVGDKPDWNNLVPVGVMWGNDPEITDSTYTNKQPTVTRINPNLQQTAINAKPELPPTHLGWNGRLNGPVDNPVSSCMSCHMTAESPQLSPLNPTFAPNAPPIGSAAWMRWFQNEMAGVPFDSGTLSTDYSLQLADGIANFYNWKCNEGGIYADGKNACEQASGKRLKLLKSSEHPDKIFKIERNAAIENIE